MTTKSYFFLFLFFCFGNSHAQEVWSLEKCVQYALDNSLAIQQSNIAVQQSELSTTENKYARYPNLNASSNYGYSFGKTIDPTTNSFINRTAGTNTWSINSNVILYNGGRINKSIEQADYDLKASKADLQQGQNNIALSVANAYLNVLFAEERLANANKRIELTQAQLRQTEKLIEAGQIPANDRYDLEATIAQNEQAIVAQQNNLDLAYLNLKQLLQLDPSKPLQIERPELVVPQSTEIDVMDLQSVYSTAVNKQPFILADAMRLESAKLNVEITKTNLYPRLVLFGSLDTRYSTQGFQIIGANTIRVPQTFYINNIEQIVEFESDIPITKDNPYFNQLNENIGQSLGLSLSIPIYNRHTTNINIERAKLNITNSEIASKQNKQRLKTDIQTALANAKAARRQLEAAEKTKNALDIAYQNAQKRLNLGAINTFQLTSAKNNLDTAEVDYIVAKYDYLFKLKIVDFYLGKPITL